MSRSTKIIISLLTVFLSAGFLFAAEDAGEELSKAAKKMAKKKLVEMTRKGADLTLAEGEKILILPTDIWLPGDEAKYNAALFAGFLAGFGTDAISLEPIKAAMDKAGFSGMSRRLAWGTWHMVSWHKSFDFVEDAGYHGGNSEYAAIIDLVAKLVNFAMESLNLDVKIKYVAFASIRSTSVSTVQSAAGLMGIECLGALYNVEEGKVDKVFRKKLTGGGKTAEQKEAFIMGQMGNLGNMMPEILLTKN